MQALQLSNFGASNLSLVANALPEPQEHEVVVRLEAASLNPRDSQIIAGQFTTAVDFPLVPLSDGAGTVTAVGAAVSRFNVGDNVTTLFFPNWHSGEATAGESHIDWARSARGSSRNRHFPRRLPSARRPALIRRRSGVLSLCRPNGLVGPLR